MNSSAMAPRRPRKIRFAKRLLTALLDRGHYLIWHIGYGAYLLGQAMRHASLALWDALWSGSIRNLLLGMPAFLAACCIVAIAYLPAFSDSEQLASSYLHHGRVSLQNKDYETARMCFERVAGPEDRHLSEALVGLAIALESLGEHTRALAMLEHLAPANKQGYTPAHLLLAQWLMSRQEQSAQTLHEAELHLLWALQAEPNAVHIRAALGRLYLTMGRPQMAEPHVLAALAAHPEFHLPLAHYYSKSGNREKMDTHAEKAASYYRAQVEARLESQLLRFQWASALQLVGKHPEAVAVLERGFELTQHTAFRVAEAQAYVAWSDTPGLGFGERLQLLERALAVHGQSAAALERLASLAQDTSSKAAGARAALQSALARGQSSPMVHFLLGSAAWREGKLELAKQHLEQAYQLSQDMPVLVNNLAWILANGPKPDLERALTLANSLIERWPSQANFRDTRGQILVKLDRWKEAVSDLEIALRVLPDKRGLHKSLAEVYGQLGNPEMAAEHRKLANAKGVDPLGK